MEYAIVSGVCILLLVAFILISALDPTRPPPGNWVRDTSKVVVDAVPGYLLSPNEQTMCQNSTYQLIERNIETYYGNQTFLELRCVRNMLTIRVVEHFYGD